MFSENGIVHIFNNVVSQSWESLFIFDITEYCSYFFVGQLKNFGGLIELP